MTNQSAADNRLTSAFADLRAAGRKTLLPFITAGYPDLETTAALLADFEARGVRICELGIPFSDPVADGPVIQASYTAALAGGVNTGKILDMVRAYRAGKDNSPSRRPGATPHAQSLVAQPFQAVQSGDAQPGKAAPPGQMALVAMVSYSIVFRHGVKDYFKDCAAAGIDGIIIPDLPLEEEIWIEPVAQATGLCNIMLIAPTTGPARRIEIARHSRGFVYYMSIAGITGERARLPQATIDGVRELRTHTDQPICVGFGISNAATVKTVCQVADGAIVGSAIVHRITDAVQAGVSRRETVLRTGKFVSELLEPLR
jgi:tryptophan synthase alpha chain